MADARATGFKRVWNATRYSMAGLRAAWRHEAAFRQEVVLVVLLVPLGLWLGTSSTQRALLLGTCLLVLVTELLNSALETAVDRVGLDHNSLSGRAKDLGSAAVFVSLIMLAVVWGLIAWERFAA